LDAPCRLYRQHHHGQYLEQEKIEGRKKRKKRQSDIVGLPFFCVGNDAHMTTLIDYLLNGD